VLNIIIYNIQNELKFKKDYEYLLKINKTSSLITEPQQSIKNVRLN